MSGGSRHCGWGFSPQIPWGDLLRGIVAGVTTIVDAPGELALAIKEFWPEGEWDNAASIAYLESAFNAFAENDTTWGGMVPCGTQLEPIGDQKITAEHSIGYFQINSCNFPTWQAGRFFNARHNAGTAHLLWAASGWQPWYFSAKKLGLL
jgi:hypothetical protein